MTTDQQAHRRRDLRNARCLYEAAHGTSEAMPAEFKKRPNTRTPPDPKSKRSLKKAEAMIWTTCVAKSKVAGKVATGPTLPQPPASLIRVGGRPPPKRTTPTPQQPAYPPPWRLQAASSSLSCAHPPLPPPPPPPQWVPKQPMWSEWRWDESTPSWSWHGDSTEWHA